MSMMLSRAAGYGLFFSLALTTDAALAAPDAKQIADALIAAMTADGDNKATYTGATASGEDITITGLTITGDNDTATFPTVVISGAVLRDPGGFTATSMTLDNGNATSDGDTFKWATASVEGAIIPTPDEIKAKKGIIPFSKVAIVTINITGPDMAAPVDIASINAEIGGSPDGPQRDFKTVVADLKIPAALLTSEDEDMKAVIEQLGYTEFLVDVTVDGGFDTAADILTLRTVTIDTADVAKLGITGKFNGVSMKSLAEDDGGDDAASKGKLETLTIRFDNSGIVERGLDMQAKMMGGTREEVADQLAGALPLFLNALENPAFQDKVAAAATAFLKDPKSLTITATPATPVSFEEIMKAIGGAPASLPALLSVEITANN